MIKKTQLLLLIRKTQIITDDMQTLLIMQGLMLGGIKFVSILTWLTFYWNFAALKPIAAKLYNASPNLHDVSKRYLILLSFSRDWQWGFQDPVTEAMYKIISLHNDIMFFLILIIVFVLHMLVTIIIRFADNNIHNIRFSFQHHTNLERIWTIIPTLILICIAAPSWALLYQLDNLHQPELTLKIIGNQWYWSYEFNTSSVIDQQNSTNEINELLNQQLVDVNNKDFYNNYIKYASSGKEVFKDDFLNRKLSDFCNKGSYEAYMKKVDFDTRIFLMKLLARKWAELWSFEFFDDWVKHANLSEKNFLKDILSRDSYNKDYITNYFQKILSPEKVSWTEVFNSQANSPYCIVKNEYNVAITKWCPRWGPPWWPWWPFPDPYQTYLAELANRQMADICTTYDCDLFLHKTQLDAKASLDKLLNQRLGDLWRNDGIYDSIQAASPAEKSFLKDLLIKDMRNSESFINYTNRAVWVGKLPLKDLFDLKIIEICCYDAIISHFLDYPGITFEEKHFVANLLATKDLTILNEILGVSEEDIKKFSHSIWTYNLNMLDTNDYVHNSPYTFDSYMVSEEDLYSGKLRLLEVDNKVFLPIETPIRLLITSADVLHSWSVPSFGVKMDACPGRLNQVALEIQHPGVYYGQCSELCGVNHAFMPIVVHGVKDW